MADNPSAGGFDPGTLKSLSDDNLRELRRALRQEMTERGLVKPKKAGGGGGGRKAGGGKKAGGGQRAGGGRKAGGGGGGGGRGRQGGTPYTEGPSRGGFGAALAAAPDWSATRHRP